MAVIGRGRELARKELGLEPETDMRGVSPSRGLQDLPVEAAWGRGKGVRIVPSVECLLSRPSKASCTKDEERAP